MRLINFCGDVHGKWEEIEKFLKLPGEHIFVGDFMDSFERSLNDHEECLKLVIAACEAELAEVCFGNHELSYIRSRQHRCSGYDPDKEIIMLRYGREIRKHFKDYIWIDKNILVSHAGLSSFYAKDREEAVQALLYPDIVDAIGWARGGRRPCGGIFWCDWYEFTPVPGLIQIFGHSRGEYGRVKGENLETGMGFCIDYLDTDTSSPFLLMQIDEESTHIHYGDKSWQMLTKS